LTRAFGELLAEMRGRVWPLLPARVSRRARAHAIGYRRSALIRNERRTRAGGRGGLKDAIVASQLTAKKQIANKVRAGPAKEKVRMIGVAERRC